MHKSKIDPIKKSHQQKFYISWGWNSGWFGKSDLKFIGNDFDFVLNDVSASDRQSPFGFDPYFHPTKLTIPQTNFRVGYFLNDKWNISLGFDHMKYVLDQYQMAKISGTINVGNEYDGLYENDLIGIGAIFFTV